MTNTRWLDQRQKQAKAVSTSTLLVFAAQRDRESLDPFPGIVRLQRGSGERAQAERALQASETQLGLFVDQAPVSIDDDRSQT
jgi:hypothetical protein